MEKINHIIIICILLFSPPIFAKPESLLTKELIKDGFQNVNAILKAKKIIINYENHVYRSEIEAIEKVIKNVIQFTTSVDSIILIPMNYGIPLIKIEYSLKNYNNIVNIGISQKVFLSQSNITLNLEPYENILDNDCKSNMSYKRIEIILQPNIGTRFNTQDGIAIWKIDFLPELSITICKGTHIIMETIFPIYYQFDKKNKQLQLGRIILNHTRRLPHNLWISSSVGIFNRDRYGFSVESSKYFKNGKVSLTARANYTGYLNYDRSIWYYSELYQLSYWLGCDYRFRNVDFLIRFGWGKYLYYDTEWKIEMVRSFGEFDMGFYGLWPNLSKSTDFLAGCIVNIPIPYFRKPILRNTWFKSSCFFPYRIQYHTDFIGATIDTENSIDKFYKRLFPSKVKHELETGR